MDQNKRAMPHEPLSGSSSLPLRIGVSQCLLGAEVRFDGGHKRDSFVADTLSRYVEWVPVCPEVESGLGTPREAMRLVGSREHPRLLTITSHRDVTDVVDGFSERRVRELEPLMLSGYVFKKDSPSCGIERVRVYSPEGMPDRRGIGLFAKAFMKYFPLTPVEEEGRLLDPGLRENFIERVFCYHRWQCLMQDRLTRAAIVHFHTVHKLLLLAHSRRHYQELGRLVGEAHRHTPTELARRYCRGLMDALRAKATAGKHSNVLHHIVGYFKTQLRHDERAELEEVLQDYRRGLIPLIVPLTLVKHYIRIFEIPYIQDQVYLNPHPKELMLRNHV